MPLALDYKRAIDVPENGLGPVPDGDARLLEAHPLSERIAGVVIPSDVIRRRTRALAAEIHHRFARSGILQVLPILKGAFVFAADLIREITGFGGVEVKVDFYEAETYGREIKTNGEQHRNVRIRRRPEGILDGPVLLVDDIADTVQTATAIREDVMRTFSLPAQSVHLCFLLEKLLDNPPEHIMRLKEAIKPEYVGFRIPDVWVAGYGIDAGEDFRSLPAVIRVNESYY